MAMMRHPNIIQFMGLCALPACILTGKTGGRSVGTSSRPASGIRHRPALLATTCINAARPAPATAAAELCSRGSLYDVLRGAARDPAKAAELTWQLRLRMALDAATGLLYLHCRTPQILHRDVKSPNLVSCPNLQGCATGGLGMRHDAEDRVNALPLGGVASRVAPRAPVVLCRFKCEPFDSFFPCSWWTSSTVSRCAGGAASSGSMRPGLQMDAGSPASVVLHTAPRSPLFSWPGPKSRGNNPSPSVCRCATSA